VLTAFVESRRCSGRHQFVLSWNQTAWPVGPPGVFIADSAGENGPLSLQRVPLHSPPGNFACRDEAFPVQRGLTFTYTWLSEPRRLPAGMLLLEIDCGYIGV